MHILLYAVQLKLQLFISSKKNIFPLLYFEKNQKIYSMYLSLFAYLLTLVVELYTSIKKFGYK